MAKSIEKQIVEAVLEELSGYGGFDGFWDGCDKETQADIKHALGVKVWEVISNAAKEADDDDKAEREFSERD